jgi:hypothetical protein
MPLRASPGRRNDAGSQAKNAEDLSSGARRLCRIGETGPASDTGRFVVMNGMVGYKTGELEGDAFRIVAGWFPSSL